MRTLPLLAMLLFVLPRAAQADEPVDVPGDATPVALKYSGDEFDDADRQTVRMLVQTRYGQTFAAGSREGEHQLVQKKDGWQLERAFLSAVLRPKPWLQGKIVIDGAELLQNDPEQALRRAFVTLTPTPRVELTAGLFKRPFGLMELTSIADLEVVDRGVTASLLGDMGFGGEDTGAMLRVAPLPEQRWLGLKLGAFQGGHVGRDARLDGLLVGRAESNPIEHLFLGAALAWRRHATPPDEDQPNLYLDEGKAWSLDATYERKRFEVRAEILGGDRTDAATRVVAGDPDTTAVARDWLAWWVLATARIKVGAVALRPAARVEWLDADRDRPQGQRWVGTGAVNVDVTKRLRVVLDVTRQWVQDKSLPLTGKAAKGALDGAQWLPFYDVDFTRVILQLQVKI